MRVVTGLPELGWTAARADVLPDGCEPGRVSRVDRGRLSVLAAAGERRVHPGAGLYDERGGSGPAVGDWVALRGELAVAVLPRTSAFVRTGGRPDIGRAGPGRQPRDRRRGRHTTTARELHVLPGGGLLIDTPGLRELSLDDDADGVDLAYADVARVATECRFRDCAHRTEPGCPVAAAIDDGRLDPVRYAAWRKLQAEAHRRLLRVDARARGAEK